MILSALILSPLAGAVTWSAAEYFIHNYLGHRFAKKRNFFSAEHVRHHATTSYFAPSYKKAIAAAVVGAAVAPVAISLAGPRRGIAYTAGFVGTYLGYELLHRRAHTHPPTNAYGRWLRKHHFHHHFHDPSVNHGVTSPLWDRLMGTHVVPGKVRVPQKHAMDWLVDASTTEVWPRYQDDYELVRKRSAQPPQASSDAPSPTMAA
jgi:sterol desaturase/sphingolipid hydroxylase (fatty acid hydroxylase superfamily)